MTFQRCGARARAGCLLVTLSAATCLSTACSERQVVGSARDAAASYFAEFERFERWAERSLSSDVRLQGEQALRETVFAPLRREREVVWADVRVDERQVLAYRTPLADATLRFTPIEAPTLGRVLVAFCPECQARPEEKCVVIARSAGRRSARVRMAFCRSLQLQNAQPEVAQSTLLPPMAAKPQPARAPHKRRSKDSER